MFRLAVLVLAVLVQTGCCCCRTAGLVVPEEPEMASQQEGSAQDEVCCQFKVEDPGTGKDALSFTMNLRQDCEVPGDTITILEDPSRCRSFAQEDVCCAKDGEVEVRLFQDCIAEGGLWDFPSTCGLNGGG